MQKIFWLYAKQVNKFVFGDLDGIVKDYIGCVANHHCSWSDCIGSDSAR
jgi:hypothetical protein